MEGLLLGTGTGSGGPNHLARTHLAQVRSRRPKCARACALRRIRLDYCCATNPRLHPIANEFASLGMALQLVATAFLALTATATAAPVYEISLQANTSGAKVPADFFGLTLDAWGMAGGYLQ